MTMTTTTTCAYCQEPGTERVERLQVCRRHATQLRANNAGLGGRRAPRPRRIAAEQLALAGPPPSCAWCGGSDGLRLVPVNTGLKRQLCADCAAGRT